MIKLNKVGQLALVLMAGASLATVSAVKKPKQPPYHVGTPTANIGGYTTGYWAYNNITNTTGVSVIQANLMQQQVENTIALVRGVAAGASSGTASSGSTTPVKTWIALNNGGYRDTTKNAENSGLSHAVMLGFGYDFNPMFTTGLGFSYSITNVTTSFNKGSIKSNQFGVTPYLVINVNPCFNIQTIAGYSTGKSKNSRYWSETDVTTNKPNTAHTPPVTFSDTFRANPGTNTTFGALFLNGKTCLGATTLSGELGYTAMKSNVKAFTETSLSGGNLNAAFSDTKQSYTLQTLSTMLKLGYAWNAYVSPYVSATYAYDLSARPDITWEKAKLNKEAHKQRDTYSISRGAWGLGTGVNFTQSDSLNGSFGLAFTSRAHITTINATIGMSVKF